MGIDDGEKGNLFNDVLACCLSQKNFSGAHLMVDMLNSFPSRFHMTDFMGGMEQNSELLVELINIT